MNNEEILRSLKEMFNSDTSNNESKEEPKYTVETKQIDKKRYLSLVASNEKEIITDPDYEAFINLLKHHNTKDLNYVVSKFIDNKVKIFTEYSVEEREKLLESMRDYYSKLLYSNERNAVIIEMMIVDWANEALK